jgi:hypothetical protein
MFGRDSRLLVCLAEVSVKGLCWIDEGGRDSGVVELS